MNGTKVRAVNGKRQRHQALIDLVRREALGSQEEIRRRLEELGHPATQSTISRDLEELGLVRVRDGGGELRYAAPEGGRAAASPGVLRALLGEFVVRIEHSGNLVLVMTPPGAASAVARALDETPPEGILGTVAGDDTILVVVPEGVRAATVAARLRNLAGLA